jgi:hypothetical protein
MVKMYDPTLSTMLRQNVVAISEARKYLQKVSASVSASSVSARTLAVCGGRIKKNKHMRHTFELDRVLLQALKTTKMVLDGKIVWFSKDDENARKPYSTRINDIRYDANEHLGLLDQDPFDGVEDPEDCAFSDSDDSASDDELLNLAEGREHEEKKDEREKEEKEEEEEEEEEEDEEKGGKKEDSEDSDSLSDEEYEEGEENENESDGEESDGEDDCTDGGD